MLCQKCGKRLYCMYTGQHKGGRTVYRRYECRECHAVLNTTELINDELDALKSKAASLIPQRAAVTASTANAKVSMKVGRPSLPSLGDEDEGYDDEDPDDFLDSGSCFDDDPTDFDDEDLGDDEDIDDDEDDEDDIW